MNRFEYRRPVELRDALGAASTPNAAILAGGTNLVDLMKYHVAQPARVVDINRVPGLSDIKPHADGIRIGALVTNADVAADPLVAGHAPLLASAILAGATPQLRNMATTGGNLLQRTRCYYFYDAATACNKRNPGSGCPATAGVNRIHAILGASEHCIATHPSDMCVALAALEAIIHVSGPGGERAIPMADFHRLPGDTPERDSNLEPGEVIVAVEIPSSRFGDNHTYLKLRDRQSYAFALVSVAVGLELRDGRIEGARIALGGVAHKPWRVSEAEAILQGVEPSEALFGRVADRLLAGAVGHRHNAFKIDLAHAAIIRALGQAAAATPQSQTDKRIA